MSLICYREPGSIFDEFASEVDRFLGGSLPPSRSNVWQPAVDIKETEGAYLVYADVPGVNPKDIEVTLDNAVLSISGKRESRETKEGEGYKRVERVRGSFSRQFVLPDTIDAEKIVAKNNKGVLEIEIPKVAKAQPKKIVVN